MTAQAMAATLLLWVIYPLWLLAGAVDMLCHRRTSLPTTSGIVESGLHLAQLGLIGCAVLMTLFFTVTKLTIALMAALILLHSIASFVDVAYTDPRRRIPPLEQHIHAYLEVLPWTALFAVAIWQWPTLRASEFELQLRSPLPSIGEFASVLLPALLLAVLPAFSEFSAAWRQRHAFVTPSVFSTASRAGL